MLQFAAPHLFLHLLTVAILPWIHNSFSTSKCRLRPYIFLPPSLAESNIAMLLTIRIKSGPLCKNHKKRQYDWHRKLLATFLHHFVWFVNDISRSWYHNYRLVWGELSKIIAQQCWTENKEMSIYFSSLNLMVAYSQPVRLQHWSCQINKALFFFFAICIRWSVNRLVHLVIWVLVP